MTMISVLKQRYTMYHCLGRYDPLEKIHRIDMDSAAVNRFDNGPVGNVPSNAELLMNRRYH